MDSLAHVTEKQYNLPHGICRSFALQESNYNQYALRAEASYINADGAYARNIRLAAYAFSKAHKYQPSFLTEVVQRGESYGLYQIMGSNMRDMGFDCPFFAPCIGLEDQFKYFAIFIGRLLKKNNGNVSFVASEYNGGYGAIRGGDFRNKGYVSNILRNLERFKY